MKRKKILSIIVLAILIISGLSVAFIMGCSGSSDDDGSSGNATLTGTVKDADTGTIISGAAAKIDNTGTTTDSNGTYTFSNLSIGTHTLTVSATGYNSYQASITLVEGSNTKNVTMTAVTTQTGSLTGTVKYGDTLVEGVLVQLQGAGSFTTAADGVYTFSQVPYGTYILTATKTGYSDYTANVTVSAATNTFNISLTTSQDIPAPDEGKGNVVGYVTDDSGNPLANVACTLYFEGKKDSAKTTVVYTDANGRYVFLNMGPGTYQLAFSLAGYDIPYIIVKIIAGAITEPPTNTGSPSNPNPDPGPVTPINHSWQKNYGGNQDDMAFATALLADGGSVMAGYTYSSANGDVTGVNKGTTDVWIVRLNSSGELSWQKNYGGSGIDTAESVAATSDGGCIAAGRTTSSASGDVTGTSKGGFDVWVVKMDSSGDLQWQKNYGGNGTDEAYSIQQTSDGGYIVGGYTTSSANGDVTGVNKGETDFWIVKLNSTGDIQWQKNYGGNGRETAKSIQQTSDGGYIVAGHTTSSANGDVSGTSKGSYDYWVVKLDNTGAIQWEKNYGGNDFDQAFSMQQTSDGGYIVAGNTSSSANGDVTGVNKGVSDYWIVKLDSAGAIQWQKNYGGSQTDNTCSIRQTGDGGYVTSGHTVSSANGDVTGTNKGSWDVWIVKLDSSGTVQWQYNYGGSQDDMGFDIRQTSDGDYIIGGYTSSSASGDVTGASKGLSDFWVVKLNSNGTLIQ